MSVNLQKVKETEEAKLRLVCIWCDVSGTHCLKYQDAEEAPEY